MLPTYALTALVVALALVGLVTCFARWHWLTLAATASLMAALAYAAPPTQANLPYWLMIVLVPLTCLLIAQPYRPARVPARRKKQPGIVVDGTNVIYWDDQTPQLETLRAVVSELQTRDFEPLVFLDASTRHHLKDTSLTEKGFARALSVPHRHVMVCPAGTEADSFILKHARAEKLPILSNDRFNDRREQAKGLKIVKGVITGGRPIFDGL